MPKKVAISNLNASTIDILNVIRANASAEYQALVPKVNKLSDIKSVGEVIYGYPAIANQFLNALINRIALVRVKSALFNNPYVGLKKGYLEYGETIEEIFVEIVKARVHNPEKSEEREFKRSLPDVRSAFHTINWKVEYPITIQDDDLKQAFLSENGVTDLIARIVDAVYTSAEYDEFLVFKYMLIKGVTSGKLTPISAGADFKDNAVAFRGISNKLGFMSNKYNVAQVHNTTPKRRQHIFMSADYNASFDVNVLASAFNMDKTDFIGRLHLVDDWTTFDNDRFSAITEESDMLELVTDEELVLMQNVKAILVDEEWFQVYDNNIKFTEKYVASGLYWNYFLHNWKTFSFSPFANGVVFTGDSIALPTQLTAEITDKSISELGTILTVTVDIEEPKLYGLMYNFVQGETETTNGIAVHKYGAYIIPSTASAIEITPTLILNGVTYTATSKISSSNDVGATITLQKANA